MRRPARIAIASAAMLIALGVPFLGIEFTAVDASVLPPSASARQVDDALKRDFPAAQTDPIYLLGRWNWWAPRPLRRLHERFGLSEREPRPAGA